MPDRLRGPRRGVAWCQPQRRKGVASQIVLQNQPKQSMSSQAHHLNLDPKTFKECLNREPFGFTHNLSGLGLFDMDSLRSLAKRYDKNGNYFVAAGASAPGAKFYSAPRISERPSDVFDKLNEGSYRILLKRVDRQDERFRKLLELQFQQIMDLKGGLGDDRVERLESGVFISSAATTTPFHFDPEVNFFSQIAGEKTYHVYSPSAVTEEELERFYFRGTVNIGQIDLAGRDPKSESVFKLGPGRGLQQPQNAPHWVETGAGLSISYSFVYETTATRVASRARALNFYLRKVGLKPRRPGDRPRSDTAKAKAMGAAFGVVLPVRRAAGNLIRKVRGR